MMGVSFIVRGPLTSSPENGKSRLLNGCFHRPDGRLLRAGHRSVDENDRSEARDRRRWLDAGKPVGFMHRLMSWSTVHKHRRDVLRFCTWAVATMMAFSVSYGVSYLAYIPFRGLPGWAAITLVYGLLLAAGLIVANGVLWCGVLVVRRRFPSATAGRVAQAIACCAGADIGLVPSTRRPPSRA
jgi:hypothetical protein